MKTKVRVIAMYLPQYHPIPLNDEWWGPGFTEWTNVASAKPLFRGHNQPRIPADLGFYDLRLPEVREAQAQMAREAGIEGFMYWHYWFGKGKRLLERPFQEVLESGKPDYPFCLGWANHSWSKKTWTAKNNGDTKTKFIEQTYIEEEFEDHFYDVLPAFKDPRYITVDGKPFFLIFDCVRFPNIDKFIEVWQNLALKNGLKGIHFVGNTNGAIAESHIDDILKMKLDAVAYGNFAEAQKQYAYGRIGFYWRKFKRKYLKAGPELYSYKKIAQGPLNKYVKLDNIYPKVCPQLDRTPRAGKDAVILYGSTPALFGEHVRKKIDAISHKEKEHRILIINAWNEWGEGNYLEPDTTFGRGYLDELKKAIIDN
jgi:hypothetical protein